MIRWHTLIVLHRLGCVHIHHIAEIWYICAAHLGWGDSRVATDWIACRILDTLVWALVVAWMIWVIGWHHAAVALVGGRVLLGHALLIVCSRVVLVGVVAGHVCFFTRLWTDSTKAAQAWTSFIWIIWMRTGIVMAMAIEGTSIANRSSSMINISIWTQELVISVVGFPRRRMGMIMHLDVGLSKLI